MTNQNEVMRDLALLEKTVSDFVPAGTTLATIKSFEAFINEAAMSSEMPLSDFQQPLEVVFRTLEMVQRLEEINSRLLAYRRQVALNAKI